MGKFQCGAFLALVLLFVAANAQVIEFPAGSTFQVEDSQTWTLPGAASYVVDQVSQLFSSVVDFFEALGRMELNFINKIVDFFSSRPNFFRGSPGATEPLVDIPKPPTLFLQQRMFMRKPLREVINKCIEEYHEEAKKLPFEASFLVYLGKRLQLLNDITKRHLLRSPHFHRLMENDMGVNAVFEGQNINPIDIVLSKPSGCSLFPCRHYDTAIRMTMETGTRLRLGILNSGYDMQTRLFHILDEANEQLDAVCQDETSLTPMCLLRKHHSAIFKAVLVSKFQPWTTRVRMIHMIHEANFLNRVITQEQQEVIKPVLSYRRAMVFRVEFVTIKPVSIEPETANVEKNNETANVEKNNVAATETEDPIKMYGTIGDKQGESTVM